jgi:hypothetical protein
MNIPRLILALIVSVLAPASAIGFSGVTSQQTAKSPARARRDEVI